jgi:hypothetical protein
MGMTSQVAVKRSVIRRVTTSRLNQDLIRLINKAAFCFSKRLPVGFLVSFSLCFNPGEVFFFQPEWEPAWVTGTNPAI